VAYIPAGRMAHAQYEKNAGRFRKFMAVPAINAYQSLPALDLNSPYFRGYYLSSPFLG